VDESAEIEQPESLPALRVELAGKPRIPEVEPDEDGRRVMSANVIPGNCRRMLSTPVGTECDTTCGGRQRDGTCLLDIVRAAAAAGIEPIFEIDPVGGFWDYAGPPIPDVQLPPRLGENVSPTDEQADARLLPVVQPMAKTDHGEVVPTTYECPHCGSHIQQYLANYHFWCPVCGLNAHDPEPPTVRDHVHMLPDDSHVWKITMPGGSPRLFEQTLPNDSTIEWDPPLKAPKMLPNGLGPVELYCDGVLFATGEWPNLKPVK
jgi:hypothetical protein